MFAWPGLAGVKRWRLQPNEPEFEEVTKRARVQNKDHDLEGILLAAVLGEDDYTTSLHLIILGLCHRHVVQASTIHLFATHTTQQPWPDQAHPDATSLRY